MSSHPVQYNAPLFQRLAARREVDLTVLYSSTIGTARSKQSFLNFGRSIVWDLDLMAGYRSKVVWNPLAAHPHRRWTMLSPGLLRELRAEHYDVIVVYGWAYPKDWLAFALARARRIPFLLYGDTDVRDPGTTTGLRRMRRLALRILCRHAAGALYTGTFNRDFYIRHGVSPGRLWFSPWSVEVERFSAPGREASRRALGLRDGVCYLLFVGTLIPRKRPLELLDTVAALQRRGHEVGLMIAGSGPLEQELRARATELGLDDVRLLGFVNQRDLPGVYRAADVFVLLSERDPRATVVNEAMAAGLPVVVSSGTGVWGPGDLVLDGREGIVVDVCDPTATEAALEQMLDPVCRRAMGVAAAERVRSWGYEEAVTGWLQATHAVAAHGPATAGAGGPHAP